MNIYDCFMYFDEDLLLDLRLNMLNKYIKKFIITESTYLHNGERKKLNFDINKFKKFKDKIEYIVIDHPPKNIINIIENESLVKQNKKKLDNALKRENYQRNVLTKGLDQAHSEDLIIVSDLDEIPNLNNFKYKEKINIFIQKVFYYKFNLMQPNFDWPGSRACKKKHFLSPQWLRNIKNKKYPFWRLDALFSKRKYVEVNYINDGGWHFTSIKTPKEIHYKLKNFLHHLEYEESGLNEVDVEKRIKEKKILYDHYADKNEKKYSSDIDLIKVPMRDLPEYLQSNIYKYKDWLD